MLKERWNRFRSRFRGIRRGYENEGSDGKDTVERRSLLSSRGLKERESQRELRYGKNCRVNKKRNEKRRERKRKAVMEKAKWTDTAHYRVEDQGRREYSGLKYGKREET